VRGREGGRHLDLRAAALIEHAAEFRDAAIEKADFASPARRDSDLHDRISREPGAIGFEARTTLNEHEAGRLRSPFGLLPNPPLQTDGASRRR
jgi:hypothetical protein